MSTNRGLSYDGKLYNQVNLKTRIKVSVSKVMMANIWTTVDVVKH